MVVIQSKVQRSYITNALLGLTPDLLVAWAISYFTSSGWVGFFFALVGLQCLYLAIWTKNSLWSWFFFWISGRRKMATVIEDFLVENRFPAPPQYLNDADDYLNQVVNNEQFDCKLRIKAALELGTINGFRTGGRMQLGLQLFFAFEDALTRYARRVGYRKEEGDEELE